MKTFVLKKGTYDEVQDNKVSKFPGVSLEKIILATLAKSTCCVKDITADSVTTETLEITSKGTGTVDSGEVTVNTQFGAITTEALTTAAETCESITVLNSMVTENSVILVSILSNDGSDGIAVVHVESVEDGQFDIVICNGHSTDALDSTLIISFLIL